MLDNVMLGRYIQGDSYIHRLDSRAKLIGSILFFLIVFQARTMVDYVILFASMLVMVKLARINLPFFWRGIQPMMWLILLTAVFQILFVTSGTLYLDWGLFKLSEDGLWSAIFVVCRFVIIIGVSTLLSLTTNPLLLSSAVESLLKPFNRFGMPTHEIALIFSIALRFVPTILDETRSIMNAQRARGVDFNEGNLLQRVKAIIPILIPLFAGELRRADELANAMESRGYKGGDGRTSYRQLKWTIHDTGVFVALALLWGVILFV